MWKWMLALIILCPAAEASFTTAPLEYPSEELKTFVRVPDLKKCYEGLFMNNKLVGVSRLRYSSLFGVTIIELPQLKEQIDRSNAIKIIFSSILMRYHLPKVIRTPVNGEDKIAIQAVKQLGFSLVEIKKQTYMQLIRKKPETFGQQSKKSGMELLRFLPASKL
ncbi:MAG: hypothetical protein ACPGXY_05730 [Alphaproteobacteria bacterium]